MNATTSIGMYMYDDMAAEGAPTRLAETKAAKVRRLRQCDAKGMPVLTYTTLESNNSDPCGLAE